MMKLSTEGTLLSSVTLKLLAPFFIDQRFGIDPQLIIAKKILHYEFDCFLTPDQFMRKDKLSSLLYGLLVSRPLKIKAHQYILPPLPREQEDRIIKAYGQFQEGEAIQRYKEMINKSGPITSPELDLQRIEFLERFKNLCELWADFTTLIHTVLKKTEFSSNRKDQMVSEAKFLEFDILSSDYEIEKTFEQEIKNQVAHLLNYIKAIDRPKELKYESKESLFADKVDQGLSNLIRYIFSMPLSPVSNTDSMCDLIRWELARLKLARYMDNNNLDPEDVTTLATFLFNSSPNKSSKDWKGFSLPAPKISTKRLNSILESFKNCPTKGGDFYAAAQLSISQVDRFERQQKDADEKISKLQKRLHEIEKEKIEIQSSIESLQNGLLKVKPTQLQGELDPFMLAKTEIVFEISRLDEQCSPELKRTNPIQYKEIQKKSEELQIYLKVIENKLSLVRKSPAKAPLSSGSSSLTSIFSSSPSAASPPPRPSDWRPRNLSKMVLPSEKDKFRTQPPRPSRSQSISFNANPTSFSSSSSSSSSTLTSSHSQSPLLTSPTAAASLSAYSSSTRQSTPLVVIKPKPMQDRSSFSSFSTEPSSRSQVRRVDQTSTTPTDELSPLAAQSILNTGARQSSFPESTVLKEENSESSLSSS